MKRVLALVLAVGGIAGAALAPLPPTTHAQASPARLTFVAATCPASSSMYTRVAAGQDPTSNEHGTPANPADVAAYGCSTSGNLGFFLLANSTANSIFLDEAMTQPATVSATETGAVGATIISSGATAFVPGGSAQTRRVSVSNYPSTITTAAGMPFLDLQCGGDGVNSDNADGIGWGDQSLAGGSQHYCIAYVWDGIAAETATPTATATSASPTATPTVSPTASSSTTAVVTVNFPGLSDAHVYVHAADGAAGTASGSQAGSSTWRSNTASVTVPKATYDIRVVHGPTTTVIDGVNCAADCTVDVPLATLTVNFPGMSDVHSYAHVSDGAAGTYGTQDSGSTWKSGSTTLTLLRGTYDVRVVHGPVQVVLDGIDCTAATCAANVPVATLTVNFPGMSDVHSYAHVADGAAGTYGSQDSSSTWKANTTSMVLLQAVYDVRVVHGPTATVIDGVDCRAATCLAEIPTATLSVSFPGLSDAHTYVHKTDGLPGTYGSQDSSSTWKSGGTSFTLLRGVYDVRVVHGPTTVVLDNIDCTSGVCSATAPLATLSVSFPGLSDAHTYVHSMDGAAGTYGPQDSSSTWKSNGTSFTLLQSQYDLRVVHGPTTVVLDAIDCRAATCSATVPIATLSVTFPGLTDAHIYVHATDGAGGTYGAQDSSSTWKSNSTSFTLLQALYDVRVVHGPATTVLDNIDCRAATCAVDVPLATLSVNFPGHSNVHSYVRIDDGSAGAAGGSAVSSATWRSNSASFVLLRRYYDVLIREGTTDTVVDAVDCRGATCSANLADGVAPGTKPTPTSTPVASGLKKSFVSEADGVVTWRLEPIGNSALFVWDSAISGCEAHGNASCGEIAGGGVGAFAAGSPGQYLLVSQPFEMDGEACDVSNTAEWATEQSGTRASVHARYQCSGASTMGWGLFALFATGAAGLAWVVQRKYAWSL